MMKKPITTHVDFFVAIVVSSFLIFLKMKTRGAPKGHKDLPGAIVEASSGNYSSYGTQEG